MELTPFRKYPVTFLTNTYLMKKKAGHERDPLFGTALINSYVLAKTKGSGKGKALKSSQNTILLILKTLSKLQ